MPAERMAPELLLPTLLPVQVGQRQGRETVLPVVLRFPGPRLADLDI